MIGNASENRFGKGSNAKKILLSQTAFTTGMAGFPFFKQMSTGKRA